MKIQRLYNQYIHLKFHFDDVPVGIEEFEYGEYEDGNIVLFYTQHPDESLMGWTFEVQPQDPNYISHPDWSPVLIDSFPQLTVYNEQILFYLLYTLNSTTTIYNITPYSKMNDFMKNYTFFQLTQISTLRGISKEEKQQLRAFLWFFFLYAHPVNEETLYSCSFQGDELIHTESNITLSHYFIAFHEYYRTHLEDYGDKILISAQEIQACQNLTLAMLHAVEGKTEKLQFPPQEGLNDLIALLNDVDLMISMYAENKAKLWDVVRVYLEKDKHTAYEQFCFATLLQNFACYILYFDFDEIVSIPEAFKDHPIWAKQIINQLFGDTIFIQRIIRQQQIDLSQYEVVTRFFNEENRGYFLKS